MTSNPHIEIIEKAVHAACPELMKISMWCLVHHRDLHPKTVVKVSPNRHKSNFEWEWAILLYEQYNDFCSSEYWDIPEKALLDRWYEILGHPIEISHILRALGGTCSMDWQWYIYTMMSSGIWINARRDDWLCVVYDMDKTLSDQPHSTLEWLANQLSKDTLLSN